jgi:CubicO group peptidase (beta-lactamase class C family)
VTSGAAPTLAPVLSALEAGRREGIAPAIAAVVLAGRAVVHESAHGVTDVVPTPRPVGERALFDLASLTKVMATTSIAAVLADAGELDLDAPAARYLRTPALTGDEKSTITVRHLLAHASGWPAWRPFFSMVRGRDAIVASALAEPLEVPPGKRALYSDVGFIVLGAVLEELVGVSLDRLFDARVATPLRLVDTFYLPERVPGPAVRRRRGRDIVPTRVTLERGEILGEVDDDNAWAMGGVAGHAGLFGTARDAAALGQAWLDALAGRSRWLSAETAARFAARDATPGSERALGWDTPSRGGSSLGSRLGRGPRGAIGHLGFTGTSLWLDLDREIACALLTNHVHPDGPDKARIRDFRARFHDSVAEALGV